MNRNGRFFILAHIPYTGKFWEGLHLFVDSRVEIIRFQNDEKFWRPLLVSMKVVYLGREMTYENV